MAPLHVTQINLDPAPDDMEPAELIVHWRVLAEIAEAAASAGTRVSVLQVASRSGYLRHQGIDYHFAKLERLPGVLSLLQPDLLHVHGLHYARQAAALAAGLRDVPVLLQDHANRLPSWWRRPLWRHWYHKAAGVAFTSLTMAAPFRQAGLFAQDTHWFAIPESSTRFTPGDREAARNITGLHGNPCVLSVSHLIDGKDPLTMLDGVAQAAPQLPGLQLWLVFGKSPLREAMERRIEGDPRLAGRVHFIGPVEHARVEMLMRAADLFVSASLSESCGFAALEAIACGVTPILSDIPSFRVLTDQGRIGSLFPCGDAGALARALVEQGLSRRRRGLVREYFDEELSFTAVGRRWADAYTQLCRKQPVDV